MSDCGRTLQPRRGLTRRQRRQRRERQDGRQYSLSHLYAQYNNPQALQAQVDTAVATLAQADARVALAQAQVAGLEAGPTDEPKFTPRNVTTVEERVNTFFEVEIRVPNEAGLLKAGMPGDVLFSAARAVSAIGGCETVTNLAY